MVTTLGVAAAKKNQYKLSQWNYPLRVWPTSGLVIYFLVISTTFVNHTVLHEMFGI